MSLEALPLIGKLISRLADLVSQRTVEQLRAEYAKELEEIKHANTLLRQQLDQRHQLKLAALDKRLEVHQEAYTMWWDLRNLLGKPEIDAKIYECQQWWRENNLYLNEDAEQAFNGAYYEAMNHSLLTSESKTIRTQDNMKALKESFNRINSAGPIIRKSVTLPGWGAIETEQRKPVEPPENKKPKK